MWWGLLYRLTIGLLYMIVQNSGYPLYLYHNFSKWCKPILLTTRSVWSISKHITLHQPSHLSYEWRTTLPNKLSVAYLDIWKGGGGTFSGVHFQKCSKLSIIFFHIKYYYKKFSPPRGESRRKPPPLPVYAAANTALRQCYIHVLGHTVCIHVN